MWPVDGATIRMKSDWDGQPGSPRYVQTTGKYGPEGLVTLNDDELMYVRLNPRTHTPFGLGRVEVAFETINEFLGAHRYAARLASNYGRAICAVVTGSAAHPSRAIDPLVAGRDRRHRQSADSLLRAESRKYCASAPEQMPICASPGRNS